ncbi:MerR family transcriptional regulator [Arsenicicoccus dermatophilus]|uniref:transcriptional regulator FtsR n=1 Tax=Arsenicicoccus dermatophilus TaxID=1076331 RepID=UPI001F4C9213|nr:MerR family transcriptional regulator [Arsenicicoccus dermatophilus]MCH8612429.1 MerR family transcriptional regulator [Arsenicicoccus dermatophilus]
MGSDAQPTRTLTIGAVVAELADDFPDLTISKVRFLESKGLVAPERRPSGYRVFQPDDVERLRYVLTAQRDRFWPLEVIKDALDAMDRGLTPPGAGEGGLPTVPVPAGGELDPLVAPGGPGMRLNARELCRAADITQANLDDLIGYGLVRATSPGLYDENDLAVARAAGRLATYGLEARHLRSFRTAADREVALVEQVRGPSSRRGAEEDPTAVILGACLSLHAALVRGGLSY